MYSTLCVVPFMACYDNELNAFIPEIWAREILMNLQSNVVLAPLVHRDFEDEIRRFGETVHTRRVRPQTASRKKSGDCFEVSDAEADDVLVKLDQHIYNRVVIDDADMSKSMDDLLSIYAVESAKAVARQVDRTISGQMHRFIRDNDNRVGGLNKLSASNSQEQLVELSAILDERDVPDERNIIMGSRSYSNLLNTPLFTQVNQSGSDQALRRGWAGELFGFDFFKSNNLPNAKAGRVDSVSGTVTNAVVAGAAPVSEAVTLVGYEAQVGDWFVVDGDDQPRYVTAATVGAGDTTAITPNEAFKYDTAAGAKITVLKSVDAVASYAVDHCKEISVTGHDLSKPPQVGQIISAGAGANRRDYTITQSKVDPANAANQLILLDRALEVAITAADKLNTGPAGNFNLAFHRDALALVTRPLFAPPMGTGAMSAVANNGSMGLRVTMAYDPDCGSMGITTDILAGVALLNEDLATLWLG